MTTVLELQMQQLPLILISLLLFDGSTEHLIVNALFLQTIILSTSVMICLPLIYEIKLLHNIGVTFGYAASAAFISGFFGFIVNFLNSYLKQCDATTDFIFVCLILICSLVLSILFPLIVLRWHSKNPEVKEN